jgi:hypothetical protein
MFDDRQAPLFGMPHRLQGVARKQVMILAKLSDCIASYYCNHIKLQVYCQSASRKWSLWIASKSIIAFMWPVVMELAVKPAHKDQARGLEIVPTAKPFESLACVQHARQFSRSGQVHCALCRYRPIWSLPRNFHYNSARALLGQNQREMEVSSTRAVVAIGCRYFPVHPMHHTFGARSVPRSRCLRLFHWLICTRGYLAAQNLGGHGGGGHS